MSVIKYKLMFNPLSQSFQYVIDPVSIPNAVVTGNPARPGNIPIFTSGNQLIDSGFYLNEQGEVIKVEGGYFA